MRINVFIYSFSFLCLFASSSSAQIFLQLEKANSTKVIKYSQGQTIEFKSIRYDEYWQKGKIYQILPVEQSLVFDDRITYLKDITHFRYYRQWPNAIGTNLMRFGVTWFIFAGIIEGTSAVGVLNSNYRFGTDTAIVGGSAIVSGFLTKKLFGTVIKKINDKNRLRVVDLRF